MTAETGSSLTSASALSAPERPEITSVPSDHGFRLDDDQRLPPALPDTAQENPDQSVTVLRRRALASTADHLELVTEREAFEDQGFAGAKRSMDQVGMSWDIRRG